MPLSVKDKIIGIYIVVLLFSSRHSAVFYDGQGRVYQVVLAMILFILFIVNIKNIKINRSDNYYISITAILLLFMLSELLRADLHKFIGWAVLLVLLMLIWNSNPSLPKFILKKYMAIVLLISAVSILFSVMALYGNEAYNDGEGLFYQVFLTYDSVVHIGEAKMPRLSGFVHQASLVPAYFLLPLGISLIICEMKVWSVITIIIFSLFVMSSTAYILIIMSAVIYMFYNIARQYILQLAFSFLILMLSLSYYIGLNYTISASDFTNNLIIRTSSGISRLVIMSNQIEMFLASPFFGFTFFDKGNIDLFLLGSMVMGAGVRSGIIGLVLMLFMFYIILKRLNGFVITTKQQRFGLSLVLSSVIMMMSFQDFGFSSTSGYVLLMILMYHLKYKYINTNKLQ